MADALPSPPRLPLLSIGLLSAAALGYEVLLMRIFSIIQWHHFAYMIISLALMGYGFSGTFLSLLQRWLVRRYTHVYFANLVLFGLTVILCFILAQSISFNPEEILWDYHQLLGLVIIYLLLSLPFFFAANAIGLSMMTYHHHVSRIYAFDLFGAGIGSLGIILLLFAAFPPMALTILGILGFVAALIALWELRLAARLPLSGILIVLLLPLTYLGTQTELAISPYKALNQLLRITGTQIIKERSSPLGLVSVVKSSQIPLRHAPGLSLNATSEPPPQLALFTDAEAMTAITEYHGQPEKLDYLDQLTSAMPYHLYRPERVLILGAGGGSEVLQALYHKVPRIDAVELNPDIVELVRDDFGEFSGHLYRQKSVNLHIAEARGYLTDNNESFDLIQIAQLDSFNASSAGLYALNESYLYTVEAMQIYLSHLKANGYLSISRWIKMPPRDTLKLFATAVAAMKQAGIDNIEQRLLLIRGWQTSTLLIKNGAISGAEINALRQFCGSRSFDLAYYPGIRESEANRYNILKQPYFYLGASAFLGKDPPGFIERYKFNLSPATDDRPYFFQFFKWSALPEILVLRGQGGMPLLEWGYLLLLATLIQALAASLVLIILPLWFFRKTEKKQIGQVKRSHIFVYFSALGLAFLFMEITYMQKFILFLHHPLYAASVVLTAFLIFAGIGSGWLQRRQHHRSNHTALLYPVSGIVILGTAYLFLLDPLFEHLMTLPIYLKILISILLIAPLAFCMGIPFPLAILHLGQLSPAQIPWAWGINGCASVISAVLATLLAIHFGFTFVIVVALLLYILVLFSFPGKKVW